MLLYYRSGRAKLPLSLLICVLSIILLCLEIQADIPEKIKIIVKEDGFYSITTQHLEKVGLEVDNLNPAKFGMICTGVDVPIYIAGDQDGRFDEGDYILFYGQGKKDNQYTFINVYWLSWDGSYQSRIVEEKASLLENDYKLPERGFKKRVKFQIDNGRFQHYTRNDETVWYWMRLNTPGLSQMNFELEKVFESASIGSVKIGIHDYSTYNHSMEVYLNAGYKLGEVSGKGLVILENTEVPNYVFNNGANTIGFYYSSQVSHAKPQQVLLDWIEVEYYKEYRASGDYLDFNSPQDLGFYQFEVEGFSVPDIELFKMSGNKIVSRLTDFHIENTTRNYNLIFQDEITPNTRYIALARNNIKEVSKLEKVVISDLRNTQTGADYIIITHQDFYESALKLSEFRSSLGLRTMVVDIEDIYNNFSYGIFDPRAIRKFVKYAYHNWPKPVPRYLVLLGDSSWWYKRDTSFVPSYTYNTRIGDPGSEWGPSASDDYYVTVAGDDPVPDIYVGRIPASTKEEAQIAVNKIISYETNSLNDSWQNHLLFISGRQPEEPQLIFQQKADEFVRGYVNDSYRISRIQTAPGSPYHGDTEDLLTYFNQGCSLIRFAGHGGGSVWSDDDLFSLEDVSLLQNIDKLPFVTSWTCFTAWFDNPYTRCLAEELLFLKNGGAVALFGATGLGLLYADLQMEEEIYKTIFQKNERILGRIVAETKASFMTRFSGRDDYIDLSATYVLIGDPATRLVLPKSSTDQRLPDLQISSLKLNQEDGCNISASISNYGLSNVNNVSFKIYKNDPFIHKTELYSYIINSIPKDGKVNLNFSISLENSGEGIYAWVDPLNEIMEIDETNNIIRAMVNQEEILITPENGSNGWIESSDYTFSFSMPQHIVTFPTYANIEPVAINNVNQPDIEPAIDQAYRLNLSTNNDNLQGTFAIDFQYDGEEPYPAIYKRLENTDIWIICDDYANDNSKITANVKTAGVYALMFNNDTIPPVVNLSVKNQGFAMGDMVSAEPQFSILAQDDNGIKSIVINLDNAQASDEYIFQSISFGEKVLPVEYNPKLNDGNHTVEILVTDTNGLSSSKRLDVFVVTDFMIQNIANRPNPCSRETLFTYVLTQPADEMYIRIYTASGRKIKELYAPASAGYNEINWNLRDEKGRLIANGVYFYKLVARGYRKRIQKIGKMAVLR
ncbi:T9SS type A sorting domain-containing protein [Candidatus Poribacteria bacterium]|nr:T9SS type A sorting domain-containing protein [Candidatus Poribacteria bacterium]